MKRILAMSAVVAVLANSPASQAAPGDVVVNPDWARRPDADSIGPVYPARAARIGVIGKARIRCIVSVKGVLEQCEVMSEGPPGWGFGAAALAMTRYFTWRPQTVNGVPVGGAPAIIPVRFGAGSAADEHGTLVVTAFTQRGGRLGPARRLDEPVWSKAPTPAQLAAAFPSSQIGKTDFAYVILRCKVKSNGLLTLCDTILSGSEDGAFKPAALTLADSFRLAVADYDPSDLAGASVDIPVTFAAPGKAAPKLTAPQWVRAPDAAALAAIFPSEAKAAGVLSGAGVVKCRATHEGKLADCNLVSEDPAGLGFGQAALKATDSVAMSAWSMDGGPVDDAIIEIPIQLNLPGSRP